MVSKHTAKAWAGKGHRSLCDVDDVEVRGSWADHHRLWFYPEDEDHLDFWFVTGWGLEYKVWGYMKAEDGKKEEYWEEGEHDRPCYYVPTKELTDPGEPYKFRSKNDAPPEAEQ